MIHYIFQNLRSNIKKERFFLLLIALVQIVSVIVILLSYGLINHFNTKVNEVEGTSLHFSFEVMDDSRMGRDEIYNFYGDIASELEDKLDYLFVMGLYDGNKIMTAAGYTNGRYDLSRYFSDIVFPFCSGNMLTNDMVDNAEKTVIVTKDVTEKSLLYIGEQEYSVVGYYDDGSMESALYCPYTALPDMESYVYTSFFLTKPLTQTQYNLIKASCNNNFHGKVTMPEFDGIANDTDYRVYSNMIFLIAVMVLICGMNYCVIYQYLLEKNKKAFSVFRICGCTRGRAMFGYMTEMMVESLIFFAIGAVIFARLVFPMASSMFEYIKYYYSPGTYWYFLVIYILVLFITYMIQIRKFVSPTPAKLIKEV